MFSVPLEPHMREASLAETKGAGGGRRDVDDPAADERSPIDDLEDRAAAVVEIDHLHSRPHRERLVAAISPPKCGF